MSTINDILQRYQDNKVKIEIRMLDDELVLVEGNEESLRFLSELFLAVADAPEGKVHLSPNGAGSLFFNKKSQFGIYINKK